MEFDGFAFVTDLDVPNQLNQLLEDKYSEVKERRNQVAIRPVGEMVP
jgi:hypothetical protein